MNKMVDFLFYDKILSYDQSYYYLMKIYAQIIINYDI